MISDWYTGEPPKDGKNYAATGNRIIKEGALTTAHYFRVWIHWDESVGEWLDERMMAVRHDVTDELFFHCFMPEPEGGAI